MFDLTQYTKAYAPSFTNLAKEKLPKGVKDTLVICHQEKY